MGFISMPGGWEWMILLVIGLLIFGRRLPEVGRSLGKSIVEFKKGIKGIEDEIDAASGERSRQELPSHRQSAPRFEGETRAVSRSEELPDTHTAG